MWSTSMRGGGCNDYMLVVVDSGPGSGAGVGMVAAGQGGTVGAAG